MLERLQGLSPHRRTVLAAGLGAGLGLMATGQARAEEDRAFSLAEWTNYEIRLRARLADAGGGAFDEPAAQEILTLTNAERDKGGVNTCVWHQGLADTARAHAGDLATRGYVEHLSPEGFDPSHRLWLVERRMIGSASENIAYRRASADTSPADLMDLWRDSPTHWENLLSPRHTHAGFGVLRIDDRVYAVGLYAHPLASLMEPLPFRIGGIEEVRSRLLGLPAELQVGVDIPQGAAPVPAAGRVNGVYQVNVSHRLDADSFEVIGGPIFVWV